MNWSADDQPCDSLSAAAMTPHPRSVRPLPRRVSSARAWAGVTAVLATAGVLWAGSRSSASPAAPEACHVAGRTVTYSSGFAQSARIRTIAVEAAPFAPVIAVSGKTSFDPAHVAVVGARVAGIVRRVAKYEGDPVARGEALAEIASPSEARREAADSLRARTVPAHALGVSQLRSPRGGTIVERRVVTGQAVRGESVLFVIADLDRLWLELVLAPEQARVLRTGERVELSREGGPSATGRVVGITTTGSASEVAISVAVDNRSRALRLGQRVNARIFALEVPALVVPNRALAEVEGKPTVFLAVGPNSASAVPVTLGEGDGQQTVVRVGLTSGQRIVSDGVSSLKEAAFL